VEQDLFPGVSGEQSSYRFGLFGRQVRAFGSSLRTNFGVERRAALGLSLQRHEASTFKPTQRR
jgi:hypothetical protein